MDRSPGFGSIHIHYGGLFSLAFTMPPTNVLGLRMQITRWIVLQKARRHPTSGLRLLVRTQFQVLFHSPSGVLLTFPSRYLFTIDRKIYLALEGGPSRFNQGFTCPDLLNTVNDKVRKTWYTGLSPSLAQISNCFYSHYEFLTLWKLVLALSAFCDLPTEIGRPQKGIYRLQPPNNIRLTTYLPLWSIGLTLRKRKIISINYQAKVIKVWALPRSLATTYGIIGYFLFLGVLRCFSSPGYHSSALYIQAGVTRHNSGWVSPFGYLRIKSYVADPRSFSQLFTSFIGILRQGILCVRLTNFLLI